ncbi:MAG TPA: hypothetical protein VE996_12225 [Terriglobales bacterium]|nr:hypothetical protein [Terriglobales bacterium]
MRQLLAALALALCWPMLARAQASALPWDGAAGVRAEQQRLLGAIERIPIFDNHGHPGYAGDPDVDAMPGVAANLPLRLRPDNPEWAAAARALWRYPYDDLAPAHAAWLARRKQQLERGEGRAYFDRILDALGIETAVANRVRMPAYLDPQRFRWVFFVDSLLFPFDTREYQSRNPDLAVYIPAQVKLRRELMAQAGAAALPATLGGYEQLAAAILRREQARGGVGMKFEIAYFRSLHFADPPRARAAAIYARWARGGAPPAADYAAFQDYFFRFLLLQAARLRLPVQIHTAVGPGDYFSLTGGDVLNLENILRDPRYSGVTFVLLHGGYPFDRQAIWLAARKNVYLDSSLMEFYLYPGALARTLRRWLELYPDKIVFGSDAYPFDPAIGAEECYWLAVKSVREALAAALAGMVEDGEVSEARALQMARAYLHDTAARLYARP